MDGIRMVRGVVVRQKRWRRRGAARGIYSREGPPDGRCGGQELARCGGMGELGRMALELNGELQAGRPLRHKLRWSRWRWWWMPADGVCASRLCSYGVRVVAWAVVRGRDVGTV